MLLSRPRRNYLCYLPLALFLSVASKADLVPQGPELQISETTTNRQINPAVAATPSGGFVVAWDSLRDGGGDVRDVYLRIFGSDGAALGDEILAASPSDRVSSGWPDIGVDAAGNFVLSFSSQNLCCSFNTAFLYRGFDAAGVPNGVAGSVDPPLQRQHAGGNVAVAPGGAAALTWLVFGDDGSIPSWGGYTTFVDAAGNEDPAPTQQTPDWGLPNISASPAGNFLMVWGTTVGIRSVWLAADGTVPGADFEVYAPDGEILEKTLSGVQSGEIGLVVWSSRNGDMYEIFGQRVRSDGSHLGTVFPILEAPFANGPSPLTFFFDLAVLPTGEFLVAWQGQPGDSSPDQFYARHFRRDGVPWTAETLLNVPSFSEELRPRIAATSNEGFVVAWQNEDGRDGDLDGIFAQRYEITRPEIFSDGFEIGNVSAWSSAVP